MKTGRCGGRLTELSCGLALYTLAGRITGKACCFLYRVQKGWRGESTACCVFMRFCNTDNSGEGLVTRKSGLASKQRIYCEESPQRTHLTSYSSPWAAVTCREAWAPGPGSVATFPLTRQADWMLSHKGTKTWNTELWHTYTNISLATQTMKNTVIYISLTKHLLCCPLF